MAHIFVSQAHTDADFVELLKIKLRDEGLEYWVDTEHLEPGTNWREEIDEAIRAADAMIVVMSPEAKASEYVTYEWGFAVGARVPIIPLLLRQTPLHPRLEAFQHLGFTQPAARPWDRLLNRLRTLIVQRRPELDETATGHLSELDLIHQEMRVKAPEGAAAPVREAIRVILTSRSEEERTDAIHQLANTSGQMAQDALASVALFHPRRDLRVEAAVALAPSGDGRAVKGLIEGLFHKRGEPRRAVTEALVDLGEVAVTGLFESLRSRHPKRGVEVRRTVAEILGRIGNPGAQAELVLALDDPDDGVQEAAVKAISRIGNRWAVPGLVSALAAPGHSDAVRQAIAQTLGSLGDFDTVPGLLTAMKNPDFSSAVRETAGEAVGQITGRCGEGAVVPMLEAALRSVIHSRDRDTEGRITHVLMHLGSGEAKAVLEKRVRKEL